MACTPGSRFATALSSEAARGKTYELGGPTIYSFKELMDVICDTTGRKRLLLPIPFGLAMFKAFFLQMAPKPLLTPDQVRLLKVDNVVSPTALTLADPIDRAWRRTGLALDRSGFTVEDRDRAQGVYFVRYVAPVMDKSEPGFFSKLFSSNSDSSYRSSRRTPLRLVPSADLVLHYRTH